MESCLQWAKCLSAPEAVSLHPSHIAYRHLLVHGGIMNWQQVGKVMIGTSLALGAAAAFAQQGPVGTYPQVPVTTDATAQSIGTFNYGVCSTFGSDTSCYHNWLPTRAKNKVLLYTRTAGVRQASLGTPLAAGLNPPL